MNTTKKRHEKPHTIANDKEIAECAYFIWESEGHPAGKENEHWQQAQMQLFLSRMQDEALENETRHHKPAPRTKSTRLPHHFADHCR